jgi:hypothetical protein
MPAGTPTGPQLAVGSSRTHIKYRYSPQIHVILRIDSIVALNYVQPSPPVTIIPFGVVGCCY